MTRREQRSTSAKAFGADAVRFAVAAHIRHAHTSYDELLASGLDRREARAAALSDGLDDAA